MQVWLSAMYLQCRAGLFALYLQDSAAFAFGFADSVLRLHGEWLAACILVTSRKLDGVCTLRHLKLSLFLAVHG